MDLAGSRAAASVSLTIGVAFATLLAAGGILIGPAILDCNHESAGIGACLRGKAERAGLLHDQPRAASSAPVVTVELPAPPLMAPEPQRPQGWLEANANEYQAPLSNGSVQLTPPIGAIGAAGRLTLKPALQGGADVRAPAGVVAANGQTLPAPEATAQIALAQPAGRLAAAGQPSLAAADRAQVALALPDGRLDASGTIVARPDGAFVDLSAEPVTIGAKGAALPGTQETSADVAVVAPAGRITLEGLSAPGTGASAFAEPSAATGAAAITGSITSAATKHGTVALEAEAEIPQVIPAPVTAVPALPPLPVPKVIARPKPPKAATVTTPLKTGPKRVIKADPRYPNVLVLPPPPPIAGANSSFATLEIR